MYHGIINVYKEKGFTSHDVVAKLRGICKQKKIGHTGTLDPDAEGVLPVCLGKATKLCETMTDKDKTYEACLRLGVSTDTQDMTGNIIAQSEVEVSSQEVRDAIHSFLGEYDQIPPMYSALKVNGKKLYEYAREGIIIERKPRRVTIYSIEITRIELPLVWFQVECSKGTYIRALCQDIGDKLGCGGAMESLKRTRVSSFKIKDSLTLSQIEELQNQGCLQQHLFSLDEMFRGWQTGVVKAEYEKFLYNGNQLYLHQFETKVKIAQDLLVYDRKGNFIGVYQWNEEKGFFKPWKLFLPISEGEPLG